MIHTVRVTTTKGPDLVGESVLHDLRHFLQVKEVEKIISTKVYRLEGVDKTEAKQLAEKVFSEPINQTYSIDAPLITDAKEVIEIAYRPGVMNPEVASIIKAAKDLGVQLIAADSSREYGFYGKVNKENVAEFIGGINLYNKLVEHVVTEEPKTLLISGVVGKTEIISIRKMNDEELLLLSKDKLFLNLEEMKVIQNYFQKIQRDPTDLEVETLAQTWSEHSGHKTFKAEITIVDKSLPAGRQVKEPFIKRIKKEALKHKKLIISAFVDNSGVMDFYDGYAICGKAETHNSPSAIEPYGGAMTGSGGVFRDIVATGQGAKTLVSTDVFCLASPDMDLKKLPAGCLPPRYLLKRVVAAVRDYGNRIGIPTNNGSFHFHDDFRAKPTVLVGAYGIVPKDRAQIGTPKVGDIVVSIGGRVGRDGIHGATFSSGEMTDRTITVNAQAVQIGNAIEEKRMFDAILEARDKNCIRAIQDSGGGGLSSAIGEIGSKIGVKVQLQNERLKYPGLSPWEIWVSESQERMVLAISRNKLKEFKEICDKYNLEVSELGEFTGNKKLEVFYGEEKVGDLDMDFLRNGLPQRKMTARKPSSHPGALAIGSQRDSINPSGLQNDMKYPKSEKEWIDTVKKILEHGNVNSKEPIVRLYDHSVQGTNDLQPYSGVNMDAPNDAVIVRPFLDKPYGMIVSHGLNPVLNNIDSYWGSIWAGVEALANYVAVGGDYREASLINNYVWPFPDEESLWTLDRCVDAVVDLMKTFGTPVISGKDSLSSTYRKDSFVLKIPPVLCISVFGRIKDTRKTQTSDFKKTGSTIVLVGKPDFSAMGGSIYYDIHGVITSPETQFGINSAKQSRYNGIAAGFLNPRNDISRVPQIDLKLQPKVFDSIHNGIESGKITACHDVSEGGVITTLFEMSLGGNMGVEINASVIASNQPAGEAGTKQSRPDHFLFNETAGTFIVEVENEQTAKLLFNTVPYTVLGKTQKEKSINAKNLFTANMDDLAKAWKEPMRELFA